MIGGVSVLKHLEDDGDLNLLVDNKGSALILCAKCKRVWFSKFRPRKEASVKVRRDLSKKLATRSELVDMLRIDLDQVR